MSWDAAEIPVIPAPIAVSITSEALQRLHAAASEALPRETGGILLGYRGTDMLHVDEVIEVPDPKATTSAYNRSQRKAQEMLDERLRLEAAGSLLGYIGDWHSHPQPSNASSQDVKTLSENTIADGDALAIVVTVRGTNAWSETAYTSTALNGSQFVIAPAQIVVNSPQ